MSISRLMEIEDKILFGLEQIAQAFQLLLGRESRALALSPLQMRILHLLWSSRVPQGVVSISRQLGCRPATVSEAVRALVEKGLVSKQRALGDGRVLILTLTAKGQVTATSGARVGEMVRARIGLLSKLEQQDLLQSLTSLIRQLLLGGLISADRMCRDCRFFHRERFPGSRTPHMCTFVGTRFGGSDQTTCMSFTEIRTVKMPRGGRGL